MAGFRYVAVEGPAGVGKRQLAERLARYWNMRFLADPVDKNPFVERFLRGLPYHALSTQLAFLTERAALAREVLHGELLREPLVTDFMFERDELFARLTLEEDEYTLYRRLAQPTLPEHPAPDLVIYLQPSLEASLGRQRETGVPAGLLERVHEAYSLFFHQYEVSPVLIVNADHVNLDSAEDFELLLRCISEMRGQRSYFNKAV
jgi:deoxyadenosine/deoxycytidine kinase